jgi:hypothetical protein
MSWKRLLLASSAVIALVSPSTDVSAQYYYYSLDQQGRPKYDRQAKPARLARPQHPNTASAKKTIPASKRPADVSARQTPASEPAPPQTVERIVVQPARAAPVSEEEAAAKAAIDELIARDPALAAVREKPDPALAKAAAAKHRDQELKLVALKTKKEAAAAKHKEIADKTKAREDAKAAAIKAKQDAQVKVRLAIPEANIGKLDSRKSTSAVSAAPAQRMPVPEIALPPRQ